MLTVGAIRMAQQSGACIRVSGASGFTPQAVQSHACKVAAWMNPEPLDMEHAVFGTSSIFVLIWTRQSHACKVAAWMIPERLDTGMLSLAPVPFASCHGLCRAHHTYCRFSCRGC